MKDSTLPRSLASLSLVLVGCGGIDAAHTAQTGAATDAGEVTNTGSLLASGAELTLFGVTTDGTVVYGDGSEVYSLVPGGQPSPIVPASGVTSGAVHGDVLVLVNPASGTLILWTAARGVVMPPTAALPYLFDVSPDGLYLSYFATSSSAIPVTGDLHVTKTDGTGDTLLRAGVSVRTSTCESLATFIGSYVVLFECAAGGSSSARPLTTFAEPAWTAQTPFTGGTVASWNADPAEALVATTAGLQVVSLAGGGPVEIDPTVTTGTGIFGAFAPGGTVLYATPGGALERAAVGPSPDPTTLVASGVRGFAEGKGLSPDGRYALVIQSEDPQNGLSDLRLASTITAGAPIVLSSTPTSESWGFTTDSSHALYVTGVSPTTNVGAFYSRPVDPSGVPMLRSASCMGGIHPTGPTGVLFMDDAVFGAGADPVGGDLEWVDVAQTAAPTRIATGLELGAASPAFYFYSAALNGAVYAAPLSGGGGTGIYVAPLP